MQQEKELRFVFPFWFLSLLATLMFVTWILTIFFETLEHFLKGWRAFVPVAHLQQLRVNVDRDTEPSHMKFLHSMGFTILSICIYFLQPANV